MTGKILRLKLIIHSIFWRFIISDSKTYRHTVLPFTRKNELKESSKGFSYLTTLCQPSLVNFQQSIEKTREVKRSQL